jgi:hypothetical protein
MSGNGPSRHFASSQQLRRFRSSVPSAGSRESAMSKAACGAVTRSTGSKSGARADEFSETFQSDLGRPVAPCKNISLSRHPKSMAIPALSRLDKRGGSRVVTNARRDAVDATASARKGKRRADLLIRERFAARRTNGATRVRQNRVVLAPVAGAKLSGGEVNSTELDQP